MKKKWTNNLGMKLLSLVLAALIWVVIVNIEDPTKTRTFSGIEVEVLNKDVIQNSGQVYEITEGDKVDVIVKGNKSIVDTLKPADIRVTADMRDLSKTYAIALNITCPKVTESGGTIELGSVKTMHVVLEDIVKTTLPIRFNIKGKIEEDYYTSTDLMVADPGMIEISAAKSVFNKIKEVRVDVDVSGRTSNFKVSAKPMAYDEEGDVVESENLSFDVETVKVSVSVLPTKMIPVNVELTGTPEEGYQLVQNVVYEPREVRIAASKARLDKLEELYIDISIDQANESSVQKINLNDIVPEKVWIADTDYTVVAEITIEKLVDKELTITPSDIQVIPSAQWSFSFVKPDEIYKIKVYALKSEIDDITLDDINPYIDLSGKKQGLHDIQLQFNTLYKVTMEKEKKVTVKLQDSLEATPEPTAAPTLNPENPVETSPTTEPTEDTIDDTNQE